MLALLRTMVQYSRTRRGTLAADAEVEMRRCADVPFDDYVRSRADAHSHGDYLIK